MRDVVPLAFAKFYLGLGSKVVMKQRGKRSPVLSYTAPGRPVAMAGFEPATWRVKSVVPPAFAEMFRV